MDLPDFGARGSVAIRQRWNKISVKFSGFEKPEVLTWEHVVADGGVPGIAGGVEVDSGTVGVE